VFLPGGEDPDSFIASQGGGAMKALLDAAEPLSRVLWRAETEGRDFSTPERRAGLERSLGEIVSAIADAKIADYYRRDFEQRVFDAFKRRAPAPATTPARSNDRFQGRGRPRFVPAPQAVSSQLKAS